MGLGLGFVRRQGAAADGVQPELNAVLLLVRVRVRGRGRGRGRVRVRVRVRAECCPPPPSLPLQRAP